MNIHLWTFVFQIVNFVVVAFVLHRLLYRPLHEAIDRRRQTMLNAQAETERAQREAETLRSRLQAELAETERQRDEQIREARRQAEVEKERLLADARKLGQEQAAEASRQLAERRENVLAAVQQEVVQMAVDLTQRFLSQAADRTLHRQLVARLIESLAATSPDDQRQLLIGWQTGDPAVLETAEELDHESLDAISAALTALVGKPAAVRINIKVGLISGVCLHLGGHVWDASLSASLEETRNTRADAQEAAHV